ncbi:phage holin family protein [Marasmitruncus massiliensis]|uniref:phage holin family protein n=1 Tax=Marasmitruncus massiliensis TaxID=1944642 RepID=UPI000C7CCD10|nr:phage holin family protein [Marasmitruncus massiliensis]
MNYIKAIFAAMSAFVLARLGILAPWVWVLLVAMVLDYITGMTAGWVTSSLNSRTGILGVVKKLSYIVLVIVAMMADWAISQGGAYIGVQIKAQGFVALLVIVWLLINELISIMENLGRIGVQYPDWFLTLLKHLKQTTEKEGGKLNA